MIATGAQSLGKPPTPPCSMSVCLSVCTNMSEVIAGIIIIIDTECQLIIIFIYPHDSGVFFVTILVCGLSKHMILLFLWLPANDSCYDCSRPNSHCLHVRTHGYDYWPVNYVYMSLFISRWLTVSPFVCLFVCVKIGSIEPKPHRDILMTDFDVIETAEFPR